VVEPGGSAGAGDGEDAVVDAARHTQLADPDATDLGVPPALRPDPERIESRPTPASEEQWARTRRDPPRVRRRKMAGKVGAGCGAPSLLAVLLVWSVASMTFSLEGCDFNLGEFGPGEGTQSKHLPVEVQPHRGLRGGDTVLVTSEAFEAESVVGIATCLDEADTERAGVDACDEEGGARYVVGEDGKLAVAHPVSRVITVAGDAYDCAAAVWPGRFGHWMTGAGPSRCVLVAADVRDYDQSGGRSLRYRTGLPDLVLSPRTERRRSDRLPITSSSPPAGRALADGTPVTVTATGFVPGEPILLARCSAFPPRDPAAACDPLDFRHAFQAIAFSNLTGIELHADEHGSVVVTVVATASIVRIGDPMEAFAQWSSTPSTAAETTSTASTQPSATTSSTIRPWADRSRTVDCTAAPGRCSIVVSAAADSRRSAVLPYTVTKG
jgi:hypothetical protein